MPQDVISTSNSSSHLLVRWKPPTQRNGNLTYYLVLWQRLAEDGDLYLNDYCHRGARRDQARVGGLGRQAAGAARLTTSLPAAAPGLRLPTSNNDPRFDREDGELEAEMEPGCCPCQHPLPGQVPPQLEAQEASFQKKFENFLHNAITIPKCGWACPGRAGWACFAARVGFVGGAWLWVGLEVEPCCGGLVRSSVTGPSLVSLDPLGR